MSAHAAMFSHLEVFDSGSLCLLLSSLEFSDTHVYQPEIRGLLGIASHFCKVVALELKCVIHASISNGARAPPCSRTWAFDFIRTSINDKHSGSMKFTTRLDHISVCKTAAGTNRSNGLSERAPPCSRTPSHRAFDSIAVSIHDKYPVIPSIRPM